MATVSMQCRCGTVKGETREVTPANGTRVVCYCKSCQAFARFLGNEGPIMDEYGGTDIYQMAPARLVITEGAGQIRCIRLSPKGLYRWYCGCCRTPIGNTMGPGWPFVGVVHNFFTGGEASEAARGPVQGIIYAQHAAENAPESIRGTKNSPGLLFKSIGKLLGWKLHGLNKPSPFFDQDGNPVVEPEVLSS